MAPTPCSTCCDYGQAIPPETLMVRRSGGIPNEVARL